ncbi:hypothetical protein BASA50_006746 [Batrachochytrium salamandrivorans]|uniref:Sec39 domain-containing protein n=1 Tax=Batrachochytrium salamandrivorans TaxID=1357716 RepID=A0ABQ8F9G1_9FUNG|nr:hypothetical protein BASA50_006746 [Batrachochytrium salamandrivorans]
MQLNTAVVQAVCWQTDAGHDDDDQQQDNHKEHAQSTSVMPPVRQRLPLSASVPVSFMIQRHTATTINSLTESMPAHSRSWTRPSSICASPDGLLCAVLFPDLLDIRQHRLCVCLFPLPVDAFPEWRRLAWAADASMIAVSFSNGAVLVYSLATKTCICDIQNGHLLHTTPDLMDMASLTIRPLCGLTFAAPQMLSRSNPTQHCLVAVSFDGAIAAYMMDANPLDLVCSWFGSLVKSYSLVSAAVFVDMRLLIAGKQHTPHTSDDPATLSYWDVDYNDNDFVLVGNQSRIRLSSTKAVIPYSLHGLYRLAGSVFAHYGMSTSLDVSGYISQISYCKDSNTLLVLDGCGCFYLYSATELHLRWSSSSDSSPVGKVRSAQFFGAQHLLVSTQELILQQLSIEALLGKEDSSLSSEHSITINQFDSLFVEISTTCREDAIAYILASSAHSNVVDLACLVKVTPEEKIIASIDSLDIHDIEKICRDSNTSTDQVFKSLWLHVKKEPSDTAISYLTRVQDLAFVFSQCFDSQEHNDMILTRILLQHAVARTDQIGYSDVEAELDKILDSYDKTTVASDTASFGKFGGLSATDLCVSRIRALNYLDRLDTLESIYIEGVAYEDYLRLRDIDLIDLACDFASSQKFGALEILFTRHGGELLPYRLGLLDLIPECVSPELYHRLLPCINPVSKSEVPWKIIGWRKVDWSAHKATKELLDLLMKEVSTEDRATQVHVVHSPYPSDEQHILSWYKARILCLENYTYNTQNSMELAEFAVSHGVPHVQPILDRLAILDNLLKHSSYSGDVDKMALDSPFTLSDLMRLDVHDVIELILKNSDEWTIVHDMRKLVQPLLDPSTLFNSKSIVSGLSKLGISNPNAVLAVFQSSSLDVPFLDRLLSSPMMLADIISTICYEHFSDANIPVYEKMLNLALAVLEDSSESVDILEIDGYAIERLSDLHQLTLRLKGAKILATFGILMTISDLQSMESSDSQQRQLVEKIPRQALLRISLGENKSSRDTLFQSVLIDMLELKAIGILCSISSDDLYTSFLRVAASNGMHSFIQNILLGTSGSSHGIVSLKLCQEVLVSVAREMLDNADSGNKSKGLLKNACDCLTLVEQSPDMKQELELIDAVNTIIGKYHLIDEKTGSELMPIQVRLHPDRLDLIRQLLTLNPQLNASSEMILELTRKLCGSETALSLATQLRVRAYMADAAIDEGSVDVAVYYCNELIRLSSSESFLKMSLDTSLVDSLCHVFCKLIELSTHNVRFDEKLAFIVYAIRICQSSSLETMIGHWRKIEFESILHDLEVQKLPLHKKRQNEHGNMASLFNNRAEGQATPLELPNYEALLVNLTTRLKDLDHAEPNPMHSKVSVISMHDFYRSPGSTPSGNFYSLDISTAKRNSDSLNDISSALRCQELRRSYGHNTSDLLLKFAHYSLNHDSLESLGALLSCKPALELQSFFDGFECSEEISKLASHFFVISALYQVFPGIPDTFTLVNMEYSEALKSLTSLISDSENMVLDSSRDTAVKLLEIARLFSTQAQSKRIGAISDRLSLRYQVDLERMREDIQYRNHAFSGLVSSIDSSQLKDCIDVANYLEMDCKAIVHQHITWLATSSFVTASQLSTRLQQVSEELNIDQSDIRDILISIHSKLFLSPNDKLLVLYQTLADFLSSDGHNDTSAVEQLKSRMDLLKTILSMEAVADLTLNSLRSSISSDTNGLVALMGPDPSHDRFQGMVSVLQRLDAIRPIALFLDESNLVDLDIDKSAMSSTLHMTYLRNAIARMASDWEFIDSESVMTLVFQVHSAIMIMQPQHAFDVGSSLVVGVLATHLTLDIRKSTLTLLGKSLVNTSFSESLYPLLQHMNILTTLMEIDDDLYASGGLPANFFLQIDRACGDLGQISALLIGLAKTLISLDIVQRIVDVIQLGCKEVQTNWTLPYLYKDAALDLLERLSQIQLSSDPQFAYFEEWINNALQESKCDDVSRTTSDTVSGWDDDVLDLDFPSLGHSEIRMQLEDVLNSAVDGVPPISRPCHIVCHKLLQKHFEAKENRAVALSVALQTACIFSAWGLETSPDQLQDHASRQSYFSFLLEQSTKDDQYLSLIKLLVDWLQAESLDEAGNTSHLEPLWLQLLTSLVSNNHDQLLFFIMLHLGDLVFIDDKGLLEFIRDQRGLVSYYQFSLVSFSKDTIAQKLSDLIEMLATSKEFEEILFSSRTLTLLVLIHGRSCQLARLNIDWTKLCETALTTSSAKSSDSGGAHLSMVILMIADLCIDGLFFHASRLAQLFLGIDDHIYQDIRSHMAPVAFVLKLWAGCDELSKKQTPKQSQDLTDYGTSGSCLSDKWLHFSDHSAVLEKHRFIADGIFSPSSNERVQNALAEIHLRFAL